MSLSLSLSLLLSLPLTIVIVVGIIMHPWYGASVLLLLLCLDLHVTILFFDAALGKEKAEVTCSFAKKASCVNSACA